MTWRISLLIILMVLTAWLFWLYLEMKKGTDNPFTTPPETQSIVPADTIPANDLPGGGKG